MSSYYLKLKSESIAFALISPVYYLNNYIQTLISITSQNLIYSDFTSRVLYIKINVFFLALIILASLKNLKICFEVLSDFSFQYQHSTNTLSTFLIFFPSLDILEILILILIFDTLWFSAHSIHLFQLYISSLGILIHFFSLSYFQTLIFLKFI